uniref:Uncharacterized protein n=1 Tax=Anguilla anguilla TaxID=7936 RepID=A0A0E9V7A9_ANGAN
MLEFRGTASYSEDVHLSLVSSGLLTN